MNEATRKIIKDNLTNTGGLTRKDGRMLGETIAMYVRPAKGRNHCIVTINGWNWLENELKNQAGSSSAIKKEGKEKVYKALRKLVSKVVETEVSTMSLSNADNTDTEARWSSVTVCKEEDICLLYTSPSPRD